MRPFWKREPTERVEEKESLKAASQGDVFQMVTIAGENCYAWNGKLYESDIVRACIRPKVKAIGKLVGKHIRKEEKGIVKTNPDAHIRFLLEEPNPHMTAQQMQEKVATQLCLNHNAFILIVRDDNGKPIQLYPVPAVSAQALYSKTGELYLKFWYKNGKSGCFPYRDIIHLREDCNESEIFGESPAQALTSMMNVIGNIDKGIIKAIKNSGVVRWLLKYNKSMRGEDVKRNVEEFVGNYLSVETDTFGAAGVDAKADAIRIEPKDYVPNAMHTDRVVERIYSFLNTNKKIVQSEYTENEWTAYYEAEVEPVVVQMHQTYTTRLFSRKERGYGNHIIFDANNLQCASLTTKLAFQAMVDRGAMTPNEWREIMNLPPVQGGDKPIRRLDTQVVNLTEKALEGMTKDNYHTVAEVIEKLLEAGGNARET